ncbi:LysR family transcriptional regulator, partial [Herbaspirillum frisingense]
PLGIAHRAGPPEPATRHVLEALWELKQLSARS